MTAWEALAEKLADAGPTDEQARAWVREVMALAEAVALEDLPPDHPIRQEHARLTTRLALAEGRLQQTLDRVEAEAQHSWRRDRLGQLLEGLGCTLTGRKSSWSPKGGWPGPERLP